MNKKLTRSTKDKMLGGVCAGIAEYFGIDATLVRIAYATLTVFTAFFAGLILYFILWMVIPAGNLLEQ